MFTQTRKRVLTTFFCWNLHRNSCVWEVKAMAEDFHHELMMIYLFRQEKLEHKQALRCIKITFYSSIFTSDYFPFIYYWIFTRA